MTRGGTCSAISRSRPEPGPETLRILSWNLLWRDGAGLDDVAGLARAHRPDLLLLQEAPAEIDALPSALGGTYLRRTMPQRSHGLAAWSPRPFTAEAMALPMAAKLDLPVPSRRRMAPRIALIIRFEEQVFANVHLDHGQRANRRQLRHILHTEPRLAAVIGDFNAFGATSLPGFADIGPRRVTHRAYGVLPFRLDRCLARGFHGLRAAALSYGSSDHRPILIEIEPVDALK